MLEVMSDRLEFLSTLSDYGLLSKGDYNREVLWRYSLRPSAARR
jgi:hypothetical protein